MNALRKCIGYKTIADKKPKKVHPVMEDFLRLPVIFYHTIGIDPYDSPRSEKKPGILFNMYFIFHMINLVLIFSMEIIFVVLSFLNEENLLEACLVTAYIGFVIVGIIKICTVLFRKRLMTSLVKELDSFFPAPLEKEQEQYKVRYYLGRCRQITKAFTIIYVTMVVIYDMFNIAQYALQCLRHDPDAKQILPFTPYAPWDYQASWRFYLTYLSQTVAGYAATCGHISADLMIFSVTMQVIMHFDRLASALREFQVRAASGIDGGADGDQIELRSLIGYHNKILGICDVVNEVFGVPLLINFAASSILVCFVGFQMTIGLSPEQTAKLGVILVSALFEIYLLCFFSQMLIDVSESVAYAAYDMNWLGADMRFRKMLIFLALRAQRPVCLKATVFVDISIETMNRFMKTSYKFFCTIRTMYK